MRRVARELRATSVLSASALVRGGGSAALLAGLLFAAWGYIDRDVMPSSFIPIEAALRYSVPLLFLVGLVGLQVRCWGQVGWLGEIGFVLGSIAAGRGAFGNLWDIYTCCHRYIVVEMGLPSLLLDWLVWLFAGLTLISLNAVRTKALREYGALLLTMTWFGWVYIFTDSNRTLETQTVHIVFGILFSLSWVVLGYILLSEKGK
jgi:hypothetical protein